MELRPYQKDAVRSVYQDLREHDDNPVIVIPTAGGKTPVMAQVCKDAVGRWGGRVLVLAHVKELLEQTVDKLNIVCPKLAYGIYSAGLKRRDTGHDIIVAGVQSVFRRPHELGKFDLILVDEAHWIPVEGEGMYRSLIAGMQEINSRVRVVGLTATPYRMKSGWICGEENILNRICYEIGVRELMDLGFLCSLTTKGCKAKADLTNVHVRGGEFIPAELQAVMDEERLVRAACGEIINRTQDRNSVLIFASGVEHGRHIVERLGADADCIFGETQSLLREEIVNDFRNGRLKYLVNVGVLTHGFDAPNIDCVAMLRPTKSPGLYYQMVGRGFRLFDGKENCLILDFGGNVLRHGPVDAIQVRAHRDHNGPGGVPAQKECPVCQSIVPAGTVECPDCGHPLIVARRINHDPRPAEEEILAKPTTEDYEVTRVSYSVHTKRNGAPDGPRTLRVDYTVGWHRVVSEWVCVEHTGYAGEKAAGWWQRRSHAPMPLSAQAAVTLADEGALAKTTGIRARTDPRNKFPKIIGYVLSDVPAWREPGDEDDENWPDEDPDNLSEEAPF